MESILTDFEKVCKKYPDKTALSIKGESISFADLRIQARRLASLLGGVTERPVGVMADRGIEIGVFFLAVLYSGNFYVPLDPEMPREKLQFIIKDASLSHILGKEERRAQVCAAGFAGVFVTPADAGDIECPLPKTDLCSSLYMVYTSGSTGKPKGVLKSHGAMLSFIRTYCKTFALNENEVIGNQTPFFFDASAKDFYLMATTGATLDIIPTELFTFPPMLFEYLNEKKITCIAWVPTALSLVAQLDPFSMIKPMYLKKIFFVGEVMPVKHLNTWLKELPEPMYVNLYGQSEIAGICCSYTVEKERRYDVLPIGKPLENCRIYLYDATEDRLITEPGQIGEIYISGTVLADEYYHDPQRTAASFRLCDFGDGPVKCFKTGDLAQYDCRQNLVFASRSDDQIKHMGHRIELGEIESAANKLLGVAQSCCLYWQQRKKIMLFCQPEPGAVLTGQEIRRQLREKLSEYMLPTRVSVMDRLPVNANGKIDRQKLRALLKEKER